MSARRASKVVRHGLYSTPQPCRSCGYSGGTVVDDDELLNRLSNHTDVGAIEVGVIRVQEEGQPVSVTVETFSGMGAVHERSKKAGAHSVGCVLPLCYLPPGS